MTSPRIVVSRPSPGECPKMIAAYIGGIPDLTDAVGALAAQRDAVAGALRALPEAQGDFQYGPDKWSVKQVLGHVCDAERIFAYRLLRIARADETPLPGFDENVYTPVAGFEARTLADVTDEWIAVRTATQVLVRGLPAAAWTRRGTANGVTISARAILYQILGHAEHHRGVLADRYGISALRA